MASADVAGDAVSPRPARLLAAVLRGLESGADRPVVIGTRTAFTAETLLVAADQVRERFTGTATGSDRLRVGLSASNSPEYVAVLLGSLLAGAVSFLIDPGLSEPQRDVLIRSCGIDVMVQAEPEEGTAERQPLLPGLAVSEVRTRWAGERPELDASTEICRFTSGSTRTAAGIEFTGQAVINAGEAWARATNLAATDRILCFAGAYNGLAFNTSVIPALLSGATLYLPTAALPSGSYVRRQVAAVQPSVLVGFPAIYDSLARTAAALATAPRLCLSSAARLSAATRTTLADRDHLVVSDYYGLAETGPLTAGTRRGEQDTGGQGRLLPHVEARVDHGELLVRSTSMGTRYLNYPGVLQSRLTDDGFYRTGDEGRLQDGRLHLEGRTGKGINVGGRKIAPDEVRDVLLTHRSVADAHVTTRPAPGLDGVASQILVALVVPVGGGADPETFDADLRAHCAAELARHEVPQQFIRTATIPRGGTGKARTGEIDALLIRTDPTRPDPT